MSSALADMVFTRLSTQIALSQKGQEATIKSLESRSGQIALCTNQGDVLYSTFQFDNMEWRSMLESCLSGDADVARLHKTYGNNSITYSIRSIGTFVFSETTYVLILEKNIINAYEIKTSLPREQLSALMDGETWMNANKAKELGFCDEILFVDEQQAQPHEGFFTDSFTFSRRAVTNSLLDKLKARIPKPDNRVKAADLEKRLSLLYSAPCGR